MTLIEFWQNLRTMREGFGPGDHEFGPVQLSVLEGITTETQGLLRAAMTALECAVADPDTKLSVGVRAVFDDAHGKIAAIAP